MQKIFLYITVISLSFSSCSKFLEESPQSALTMANFYRNPEEAVSAVNAAYDILGNNGIYHFGPTVALMVPSVNIYTTVERWRQFDEFKYTAEESEIMPFLYNRHYIGIMRCNAAIINIPDISMDENLKKRLIGEARFLRAYLYFNLVRLFGGVPLVTSLNADNPGRNTVEEVYTQVIQDLEEAESSLPVTYNGADIGHATKGAVWALQARVYLTRKQWDKAAGKAKQVIDGNVYSLWEDYSQAFKEPANYGKENIFEVGFKSGLGNPTSGEGNILSYYTTPNTTSLPGSPAFRPTIAFYESFEPGDRRKEWGMYTSITINNVEYEFVPHIFKFTSEKYFAGAEPGWDASVNYPLIRYADVLLMYAESLNEMNGPTTEAYDAINQVRVRAQIPPLIEGSLNQDEFRKAVYTEREHELYLEGEDWFDLVHTDRLISGHQQIGITVNERYKLFPIPQREIDVANGALVQNPGY
ncbi:MAG: RagB/SusD family nutrient uptake outer membrane protein [Chitinophagaceae bacterium]|nr:RagB/SusD family nutrient uptake outer membrane protein [Chitinophagaceae bacterium]